MLMLDKKKRKRKFQVSVAVFASCVACRSILLDSINAVNNIS
jgi:hypothetical protein